jgi:succinyl-diaminopimelate desuccinylase
MIADPVELTRRLVAFDTINPPGRERACAEFLAGLLAEAGFDCTLHALDDSRASLVARLGDPAGPQAPLAFTGHLDTVPLGAAPWTQAPFAGAIVDGRLYGRGSSDMKSGVAAFVCAAIAEAGRIGNGTGVLLVLTAGEETGCDGAVSLTEGGHLGRAGALLVGEPTANRAFVGHKGALWLKATTHGVTAHGSMPERGDNAVYKAARAIGRLEAFDFNVARHPVLGGPTLNVGTVSGGLNINSVPDRATIGIDIRTVPGMAHGPLKDGLKGYMGEGAEVETLFDLPGVWTEPDVPWVRRAAGIVAAVTGQPFAPQAAPYFTDASVITPALGGIPTLILGPGEPSLAHQTDEFCPIEAIQAATEIYRRLIVDWSEHGA